MIKLTESGMSFVNEASLRRRCNPLFEALTGLPSENRFEWFCVASHWGLIRVRPRELRAVFMTEQMESSIPSIYELN